MKKNLTIFLLIIIILISFVSVYKHWKLRKETYKDTNSTIFQPEEIIVSDSFETKVLNAKDDYVNFDIKYPSFKNVDSDFNLKIENLIKLKMEDHKKVSQEYWQARIDTQTKGENISKIPSDEEKMSFFSNFTVAQSNSNYISFILKYGGFSGGAHGYEDIVSFNYDVKNHRNIELKDLFINNTQYLTTLSNSSREYLKNQFATISEEDKNNSTPEALKQYVDNMVSMINSGTEPKEENFNTFTFVPGKLKIYFAQYQVGPYVIGEPEFEMSLK